MYYEHGQDKIYGWNRETNNSLAQRDPLAQLEVSASACANHGVGKWLLNSRKEGEDLGGRRDFR